MRLHWFLPVSAKRRDSEAEGPARGPRPIRRALRVLGPTWVSSPLRRIIQSVCLAAFLGLFLYVCWPYTARPAPAWHGVTPLEVDAETGKAVVEFGSATEQKPADGAVVHVADAGSEERAYLGVFTLQAAGGGGLELTPAGEPTAQQLEQLAVSFGPWSLSEAPPHAWPSHYADDRQAKELVPAETFLALDPLVSISTALAARTWVWSLAWAGVILAVCLVVPRGFCGYVCPLGTVIDVFDWAIGRRVPWRRVARGGWWANLKYYLLAGVLAASVAGVLVSGFVAAIPVLTRAMAFVVSPLQLGFVRGWHQVPEVDAGNYVSIALFVAVLALSCLQPRFWCRYICPSGAVFSLANRFRLTQRKVEVSCIDCGKCVEVCPFAAIDSDFATRPADCTFCQTCGGVCPSGSIKFVGRWEGHDEKPSAEPSGAAPSPDRRRFLLQTAGGVLGGAVAGLGAAGAIRRWSGGHEASPLVRPPGSVPEGEFLQLCIRCGECFQACPNNALQPAGLAEGLDPLWTPRLAADWSGCEPSCNHCGHVCPTGAIRALPMEEKRHARMGLAVVNERTCLPHAEREACQLCVDECAAAGYHAIEFVGVGTEMDPFGEPIPDSGFQAPLVLAHKCVGCGLCQTRCYAINVKQKKLLEQSAVVVEAGMGRDDRIREGSYAELRQEEAKRRTRERKKRVEGTGVRDSYLPDFLK